RPCQPSLDSLQHLVAAPASSWKLVWELHPLQYLFPRRLVLRLQCLHWCRPAPPAHQSAVLETVSYQYMLRIIALLQPKIGNALWMLERSSSVKIKPCHAPWSEVSESRGGEIVSSDRLIPYAAS